MRELKKYVEGKDLFCYLEDLFGSCLVSDNDLEVDFLEALNRVGPLCKYHQKNPRDTLIKLTSWQGKLKVVAMFQESPNVTFDGSDIAFLLNWHVIILSKKDI